MEKVLPYPEYTLLKDGDILICDSGIKIRIKSTIGQGSYGKVFKGFNMTSSNYVAVKQFIAEDSFLNELEHMKHIPESKYLLQPHLNKTNMVMRCTVIELADHTLANEIMKNNSVPEQKFIPKLLPEKMAKLESKMDSKKNKGMMKDRVDNSIKEIKEPLLHKSERIAGIPAPSVKEEARSLPAERIKIIARGVLKGLAKIHETLGPHRDIKPNNIFISGKSIKLGDFGQQVIKKSSALTSIACNAMYRAPELFVQSGLVHYGTEVDVWAAGCVFVEMFLGKHLFTGQLIEDVGRWVLPSVEDITFLSKLPSADTILIDNLYAIRKVAEGKKSPFNINRIFSRCTSHRLRKPAVDLALKLLCWNPTKRITAAAALKHEFFARTSKC